MNRLRTIHIISFFHFDFVSTKDGKQGISKRLRGEAASFRFNIELYIDRALLCFAVCMELQGTSPVIASIIEYIQSWGFNSICTQNIWRIFFRFRLLQVENCGKSEIIIRYVVKKVMLYINALQYHQTLDQHDRFKLLFCLSGINQKPYNKHNSKSLTCMP